MRICYIGDAQSVHLQRWATSFAKRGHEVHVITDKPAKIDGATVHPVKLSKEGQSLPTRALNLIIRSRQTRKILQKIKPDILHAHFIFSYGYWGMKSGARPLVLSAWGSDIAKVDSRSTIGRMTKATIAAADLIHTGDGPGKARLIELGASPEKIFIQHWGVDTTRFTPAARSEGLRRQYLGDGDGPLVTMVVSLLPTWDIPCLMRALPKLKAVCKGMRIVIVGDGPERGRLEAQAEGTGAGDIVTFTGKILSEKMPVLLASSDIYLDTFHFDIGGGGIGVAVMEALSSGQPVLLASKPGIEEAIPDGRNGRVFKGGDSDDLAEKLLGLASSPEDRARLGKAGRELALRIGDWERNMDAFETQYKKLLAKG